MGSSPLGGADWGLPLCPAHATICQVCRDVKIGGKLCVRQNKAQQAFRSQHITLQNFCTLNLSAHGHHSGNNT